ncbi:MAG: HDIG domain-containing protein [Phycisphaeraceae bacterium]|nr:HDIG domain-containing protein [Phycisphaerales bacterium]MCB9859515.1 HDIG domain-containing protein [Phycisphaeraceae bacterium]
MANETSQRKGRNGSTHRRTSIRKQRVDLGKSLIALWRSPGFGWALVIGLVFTLLAGIFAIWARERPMLAVGRIADQTLTVRVEIAVPDEETTQRRIDDARNRVSPIYIGDPASVDVPIIELQQLPRVVSSVTSLNDVNAQTKKQFSLNDERLNALKLEVSGSEPSSAWLSRVAALREMLVKRPLLSASQWQEAARIGQRAMLELRFAGQSGLTPPSNAINIDDTQGFRDELRKLARDAGFNGILLDIAVEGISELAVPTYSFDSEATEKKQYAAELTVEPVIRRMYKGNTIVERGAVITQSHINDYRQESMQYRHNASLPVLWMPRLSVVAGVALITSIIAMYVAMYSQRLRQNPERMAGLCVLLLAMLALGAVGTVVSPQFRAIFVTAPSVFVSVILAIAYDRRLAMGIGIFHALLVALATRAGVAELLVTFSGITIATWSLAEIRDRRSLVRASMWTGGTLGLTTLALGLIEQPASSIVVREILIDSTLALLGGLVVGGVVLFLLPTIEEAFDISTGMTLIELRDPKHPLLRQLQQRAPGTYNHSLNVATIAETAADAIGADALLTYVGGLYHDVGKMNKPEYFVENQSGGLNKHDRLSPAMSLLLIVGHVKDGLELAREFGLPRPLHHFIEAHHGTTLVEYFYHRAKKKAREKAEEEAAAAGSTAVDVNEPQEIEYRYPGPRPQTKEVAILMLADAIESATRSLTEPTPSRIDSLVREIANKRLLDGQFDECELTLAELHVIVESISRTVASIYHGRIAYPTDQRAG